VHYWTDLQSMHGFCCYDSIARTQNVSEYMFVIAVCLVLSCGVVGVLMECRLFRSTTDNVIVIALQCSLIALFIM